MEILGWLTDTRHVFDSYRQTHMMNDVIVVILRKSDSVVYK